MSSPQPYCILIAALGGEGGGVLMNWIVEAARTAGLPVQATSVPGVAQRTGSTSYYIEMMREAAPAGSPQPVFALVPMPARVDVVVASELVEAGRIFERGFVSPKRTTLITSTSRVYTTAEKAVMGDGRFAPEKVEAAGRVLAKLFITVDLDALARDNGTMVSATMFGALAGAGVLPWDRAGCERVIGADKGSLKGFAAAFAAVETFRDAPAPKSSTVAVMPNATLAVPAHLADLPGPVARVSALGQARCADYQDAAYSDLYVARVRRLAAAAPARDAVTLFAVEEAARRLATWMTYEDIPRVAELKTKPERFAAIREEAGLAPGQVLKVTEYLKPGADEIAAMLPRAWGERVNRRIAAGKSLPFLGRGINITTSGVTGHTVMRLLARFKAGRRNSLRFHEENAAIEAWLATLEAALPSDPNAASALAELPRLRKGYGDTFLRGRANFDAIFEGLVSKPLDRGAPLDTARLRRAMSAALSAPDGEALRKILSETV